MTADVTGFVACDFAVDGASVMLRESDSGPRLRPGVTKRNLLELLADWSPVITDLVAPADDDVVVYEIAALARYRDNRAS